MSPPPAEVDPNCKGCVLAKKGCLHPFFPEVIIRGFVEKEGCYISPDQANLPIHPVDPVIQAIRDTEQTR